VAALFLDLHTYVTMDVWVEPSATKDRMDEVEQVQQWRKVEKSMLSLLRRLATTSTEDWRVMVVRSRSGMKSALFQSPTEVNPLFHIFKILFRQTMFSRGLEFWKNSWYAIKFYTHSLY
jgi:hypothetical protein